MEQKKRERKNHMTWLVAMCLFLLKKILVIMGDEWYKSIKKKKKISDNWPYNLDDDG